MTTTFPALALLGIGQSKVEVYKSVGETGFGRMKKGGVKRYTVTFLGI